MIVISKKRLKKAGFKKSEKIHSYFPSGLWMILVHGWVWNQHDYCQTFIAVDLEKKTIELLYKGLTTFDLEPVFPVEDEFNEERLNLFYKGFTKKDLIFE